MEEDRQPNERRLQRKGDHHVPKLRSSAAHKFLHSRALRQAKKSKPKKSRNKRATSRVHGTGSIGTDNAFREQGSSGECGLPPPLRDLGHPQDESAAHRQSTTTSILELTPSLGDARPGPSHTTPLTNGTLLARKLAVVRRRLGRDGRQHMPGESLPPRSTGYYSPRSGLGFPGAPPKTDPPAHQWITTQPSKRPLEREAPETQPTHAAFPHTTRRKWTVKEDPDDIIDLTLDSSDTESIATPDEEPPLVNVSGDLRNTTASPPYERTASEPSIHGFSMGSTILGPLLNLTKAHRDKPRSFIRYTVDFEIGLANISAHGFVDQIHMKPRWGRQIVRSPESPASKFVNDACILNGHGSALLVLAHGRENNPVTIHRLVDRSSIRDIVSCNRPVAPGKPNGLTAICSMMQPFSFATGGADHAVHIWSVDYGLQTSCSASPLAIRHTSQIHSLLPIRDSSHKLVSGGADCNVNVYDLPSERVVDSIKLSNPPFHLHDSGSPSTLLIQTAHREHQFELRDLRGRFIHGNRVKTFGFASDGLRLSRFSKGDIAHSTLFACGDFEGCVHIWDLRNVKQPATQVKCFQTKITNVIWHGSHIVASSDNNHVAAIPYTYTNSVISAT